MSPSFPPAPVDNIDWKDLGFRVREVNGHIESHYSVKTGEWSEPKWVTDPYMRIHGMAPGLNYGQQAFEGIKAFRTPDNRLSIFRPQLNADRFAHSCSFISIPDVPREHFLRCLRLAVGLNAAYVPPHETGGSMYLRPLVFGSSPQLGLTAPEEFTFCVFCVPSGVYHGVHPIDALILEEFDRTAPRGTGTTKVGGNYAPVLRHSDKARQEGFGITLHLDSQTRSEIDEFSTAGFIGVQWGAGGKEGGEFTLKVPESKSILRSSTVESTCDLARSFGWKVNRQPMKVQELEGLDEVFAAGTAAALVPVKSITFRRESKKYEFAGKDGEPGPACLKLLTTLKGIQQGKAEDEFGWRHYVEDPSEWLKENQVANGEKQDAVTVP